MLLLWAACTHQGILFSTLHRPNGAGCGVEESFQMVTLSFRTKCIDVEGGEETAAGAGSSSKWTGPNADLARVYTSAYTALCVKIRRFAPCTVCAMRTSLEVCDNGVVELLLTGGFGVGCQHPL